MTTSIRVEARAHGAHVSLRTVSGSENTDIEIEPNTSQDFHIVEGYILEVKQGEPPITTLEEHFEEEEAKGAVDPFDHDGDGKPGGSKPKK